jgi:hypothetical protein
LQNSATRSNIHFSHFTHGYSCALRVNISYAYQSYYTVEAGLSSLQHEASVHNASAREVSLSKTDHGDDAILDQSMTALSLHDRDTYLASLSGPIQQARDAQPLAQPFKLPPELLSAVFIHTLPGLSEQRCTPSCAPLLLTAIGTTWLQVALSTPQLWTTLDLSIGRVTKARIVHNIPMFVQHSGVLPFELHLGPDWPLEDLHYSITRISSHWKVLRSSLDRVHTLVLTIPGEVLEIPSALFSWSTTTAMTQLHTLVYQHPTGSQTFYHVHPAYSPVGRLKAPNLCVLHLIGINVHDGPLLPETVKSSIWS